MNGGISKDKGNILFKSNSVTFLYIFVSCVKPFNTTFYSQNVLLLFTIIIIILYDYCLIFIGLIPFFE